MQLTEQEIKEYVKKVRAFHPTVHCITNIVTVNDCANVVHAVGASPIMAHHPMETAEVAAHCDALVCNMGAIDDFEAMVNAAKAAKEAGKPIVIDPVGVGGITYRRGKCKELIELGAPTCIRGNASEIRALVEDVNTTVGVDVSKTDLSLRVARDKLDLCGASEVSSDKVEVQVDKMEENAQAEIMQKLAEMLAAKYHCIVVVSGATDIITDGEHTYYVEAGDEMMTRITGTGCMSSVMIGAFLGAEYREQMQETGIQNNHFVSNRDSKIKAVVSACEMMGRSGEKAAGQTRKQNAGTMTFRTFLIDELSLYGL